jgi:hypothetical protein
MMRMCICSKYIIYTYIWQKSLLKPLKPQNKGGQGGKIRKNTTRVNLTKVQCMHAWKFQKE